jgi:predicted TIM-barrel fold metal-dependent hydrolase
MTTYDLNWMISCDDHIIEPKDLWTRRLPEEYRDRAPRVVRVGDNDFWEFEGSRRPMLGLLAAMGNPPEEWTPEPTSYERIRPSCYDPHARLKDMDEGGILASLNFGSVTGFCGQMWLNAKDKDLALVCLKTFNDWLFEEWCAVDPKRFIPCIQIPLWDVDEAVKEVERCAPRGAKAIAFTENLGQLELPTLYDRDAYWDPLWKVAEEAGLVICMHQGSGGKRMRTAISTPEVATMAWAIGVTSSGCLLDWLFSPVFHKFPKLQIALSEGGIGWMPYFLERAEEVLNNHRHWASKGNRRIDHTTQSLSEIEDNLVDYMTLDIRQLFHDHVSGCFIKDEAGINAIKIIGEDSICIEADFPHSDCKWPKSVQHALHQMRELTDEQKYKILRSNAERIYNFTPAEPPARAKNRVAA